MAMYFITVWIMLFVPLTISQCNNYNAAQNLHFPVPVGICYYSLQTLHQQMSKQYICHQHANGTKAVEYAYHSTDCSGQGTQTGLNYACDSKDDHCLCTIVNNVNNCDIARQTVYLECEDDCMCDADKYQTYSYITNLCIEDEDESHRFSCSSDSIVASSVSNCSPRAVINATAKMISPILSDNSGAFGECYEQQCGDNIGPRIAMFAVKQQPYFFTIELWLIDLLVVFSVVGIVVGGLFFKPYCKFPCKSRYNYQRTDRDDDDIHDNGSIEINVESVGAQPVPTSPFSIY